MKKSIHCIAVALLAVVLSLPTQAATTASLDKTHVALGDTVRLLLQTNASTSKQPDIAPLQQDFDVLGSSHGSNTQIINGHMASQTQVTLFLSPKHEGTIRIPPLSWGTEQSAALELMVGGKNNAPAQGDAGQPDSAPVSMTATLDQKRPYVQSSVVLTLRLYVGVPLSQANLEMPSSADVLVKQLGEDTQSTESRNGRSYQVIERKYLLIPQRSGQINLKGPTLDAQVQDANVPDINSFFGNAFGSMPLDRLMGSTRPLRLSASAIELNVQPRPDAAIRAEWLPAKKITLEENWRPDNAPVHVGEPLTRHLHITALGLTGAQLPDLSKLMVVPDGIKSYPDQAKTDDSVLSGTMLGSRDQDIALIANQSGHYDLPALKVAWWDTTANIQREVILPARSLDVLPATGTQVAATALPADNLPTVLTPKPAQLDFLHLSGMTSTPVSTWKWVSAVFAFLWLGTGLAWWRSLRVGSVAAVSVTHTTSPSPVVSRQTGETLSALQQACLDNDPQAARRQLLNWAAENWPESPPRGLQAIACRLANARFTEPLQQLDRACYSGAAWQGDSLMQEFAAPPRQIPSKEAKSVIPDLYV